MKLHEAFDITRGDVVAFIGAGGKTSTLVRLGHELAELGWRVLATTTTRIGEDQLALMPHAITPRSGNNAISTALTQHHFVFLYDTIRFAKVYGVPPDWIPRLLDAVDSDVLLVEADGARGLLLKAPYEHEPVIPPGTSLVVPIVSLEVVGKSLDENYVYNPEAIIEHYGFPRGSYIRSAWVAQVIRDKTLGLYGVPDNARVIAFINQTPAHDSGRLRARMIARLALRESRLSGVALGSTQDDPPVHEIQRPIGAVILAAGLSTRMGQPKLLLPWANGKTIIEHIVEQLVRIRLDHIVVVTGHMAKEVEALVTPWGVQVAHNRFYKTGEMLSSLQVGLQTMPDHIAAALVVLGDQPRIQPKTIFQVLLAYAEGKGNLIAPSYQQRRGHPVLISRRYWRELLHLPPGNSPRDMLDLHNQEIYYINVDNDSVLRDIDTPEDYTEERRRAGL